MIEAAVAVMAGITIWMGLRLTSPRRDGVVMQRVAALGTAGLPASKRSLRPIPAALGRRLPGSREGLGRALAAAGVTGATADEVIGLRYLLGMFGLLIGSRFGPIAFFSSVLLAAAGYKLPDLLIRARMRRRREQIESELPDVVDLLSVCTEAGLNVALSLKRVGEATPGALGSELRRALAKVELGVPRAEALAEFAQRNEIEDLEGLVATIVGAERFGTQLAPSLRGFASETRAKRRRRAEEQARRAPVKMLFPLVFLILPGFILLTLVPLVLSTFQSLGF